MVCQVSEEKSAKIIPFPSEEQRYKRKLKKLKESGWEADQTYDIFYILVDEDEDERAIEEWINTLLQDSDDDIHS